MSDFPIKFMEGFSGGSHVDWRSSVEKVLRGKPFERAMQYHTYDDIIVDALYTRETSKIRSQSIREYGEWAIVSPHWGNDASTVNTEILEDLSRGASAVAITVDETGIHGISPNSLSTAFEDVYLDMLPFTLIQGVDFAPAATAMDKLLKDREYKQLDINGLLGVDPIGALARFGYLNTRAEEAISAGAKVAEQFAQSWPNVSTFVADGTVYSNAGAGEVQELSACLSTAVTYLRSMEKQGLELAIAAKHIQFTMSASTSLWQTISKFRALRQLWNQVMSACGVTDITPRINAVSALHQFSMKDPWVNILRGTAACFGATIGGADSVTVLPHDLMLGSVNKFSRKIARNIQIILQEESNLSKVLDPAAGSYAIDTLTNEMTETAWKQFQELENAGGILSALRNGSFSKKLNAISDKRAVNIRKRKLAITGISEFPDITEKSITGIVGHSSEETKTLEAVEQLQPLVLKRIAWEFEKLRFKSDEITVESGKRPSIFLANLGTPADFTARATFAKNFFEAGGIAASGSAGVNTAEAMLNEAEKSSDNFAILCGSDHQYQEVGVEMVGTLKKAGFKRIYVAGKLPDGTELTKAGMDAMIYMGCDVVAVLEEAFSAFDNGTSESGVML
ncbi:methylmalonyl-CoA mutase subunit beta [Kordiimonas aquimaris]|uniref:methylmalonyl-CoA mutase subunit beta n=1 Tax=Kordiimonas aquimaris TaxID=707591 RepID=UPI0021CF76D2|nr:methylmalonyl-CoA mutase subunit beta [Kordiimonas aquimaris]